jgi:hypothetical protein
VAKQSLRYGFSRCGQFLENISFVKWVHVAYVLYPLFVRGSSFLGGGNTQCSLVPKREATQFYKYRILRSHSGGYEITVFWDITPRVPLKVNRRFGGTYRQHTAWKQVAGRVATCFHAGILLGLFDPEDGGDMFLRNFRWLSTDYTALFPRK